MWIKEHEFARVKLADQKYKSKRNFSFRWQCKLGTRFSVRIFRYEILIRDFGTNLVHKIFR